MLQWLNDTEVVADFKTQDAATAALMCVRGGKYSVCMLNEDEGSSEIETREKDANISECVCGKDVCVCGKDTRLSVSECVCGKDVCVCGKDVTGSVKECVRGRDVGVCACEGVCVCGKDVTGSECVCGKDACVCGKAVSVSLSECACGKDVCVCGGNVCVSECVCGKDVCMSEGTCAQLLKAHTYTQSRTDTQTHSTEQHLATHTDGETHAVVHKANTNPHDAHTETCTEPHSDIQQHTDLCGMDAHAHDNQTDSATETGTHTLIHSAIPVHTGTQNHTYGGDVHTQAQLRAPSDGCIHTYMHSDVSNTAEKQLKTHIPADDRNVTNADSQCDVQTYVDEYAFPHADNTQKYTYARTQCHCLCHRVVCCGGMHTYI